MKNLLIITKGPDSFDRLKTDENGLRSTETEKMEFTVDQFLISDGKSYWLVDADSIKIEMVNEIISDEVHYKIYQSGQILETAKEIKKVNF
jgi:hypothetical protein